MGFFDHLNKKGTTTIQQKTTFIRRTVPKGSAPPAAETKAHPTPRRPALSAKNGASPDDYGRSSTDGSKKRKAEDNLQEPTRHKLQNARRRLQPIERRLESSSEESDEDDDNLPSRKSESKASTADLDLKRRLRADPMPLQGESQALSFVHGANITSKALANKYEQKFTDLDDVNTVVLHYPGSTEVESFELVKTRDGEEFDPLEDIIQAIMLVGRYYLTELQSQPILNDSSGILRKLRRAALRSSGAEFTGALSEYNSLLTKLRASGVIEANLESKHQMPLDWVERILTQTYSRTVSLKVDSLRKYENGTDNVYGELLPRFVSKILKETKLKSDQVFVDLGSGVANVVLQAALEVGCESWGCEMMENACDLAALQETEFMARCKLWGIKPGAVHLERGNFLKNRPILKAIQRADVVLVNNQAFTPHLNNELVNLFLELKEGCQIVSLKSFVPKDHKITSYNFNSPVNMLAVEKKSYFSNCVSWTNAPGTYVIARKDSSRLREFERRTGR